MHEHQSGPQPPSAHPFPLLHNLKQQSPGLPTTRGRAYKPTRHPRQHPSCDADNKNLPFALSAASNRFGTIVEHYGVLGFGKKQPALGDEPQGRANDGETRRDHPDHAADQ